MAENRKTVSLDLNKSTSDSLTAIVLQTDAGKLILKTYLEALGTTGNFVFEGAFKLVPDETKKT